MKILKMRGRALVVGAALVVTTTLAPSARASEPRRSAPAPASWILFQQDSPSRILVALVRADGTGLHHPLAGVAGGHQTNPDWSPDGERIVFAMSDGKRDDLWVADVDGSNARRLLDCHGTCRWLDDPDWSPDGKRIVYSRTIRRADGWGVGTLEAVDVDTGKVRVELGPWRRDFTAGARYSPDGRQVVFEKVHKIRRGPNSDIDGVTLSVVRLDKPGHPVRALTDPQLYAATADWSPDGKRIVYCALAEPEGPAEDLFWIRPAGGEPTQLTHVADDGGYALEPAWRADGSGVLFSGQLAGPGAPALQTAGLDGSGPGSAFGDDVVYGRHPRVQPAP